MENAENERRKLAERYSQMPLEQLRQISSESESLTDIARESLQAEIERRGGIPDPEPIPEILAATEELPIEYDESPTSPFVMIRRFRDLPEALLAKGSLEAAGIECWLADENMVRMDWFISNFLGGVKLLVNREDAKEAAAVLNQPIPENFDVEGIGEYQQPRCPQCGSLDVSFEELNKPLAYGSAYLSVPIPLHNRGWVCHACKHKWDDTADESSDS